MKKILMLCLLWLGILGAFIFYGYFIDGDDEIRSQAYLGPGFALECRTEDAVLWGGFGIGLATCLATGLLVVGLVRGRQLHWVWAVLVLAASSVASTVVTGVAIAIARKTVPVEILQGESVMNIYVTIVLTLRTVAIGFVVFCVWVFFANKNRRNETQVA